MNDKPTPCPKCGAYTGHAIDCTGMTVEEKAEKMMQYYNAWLKKCNEHHEIRMKAQQWVVLWQGKHAILRHENNKLRKALYRQEKKKMASGRNPERPSSREEP